MLLTSLERSKSQMFSPKQINQLSCMQYVNLWDMQDDRYFSFSIRQVIRQAVDKYVICAELA